MATILTVGHGTLEAQEFKRLLQAVGVELLVDVRTSPGSRRNPQFARSAVEDWLPAADIAYRWEPRLGGWRKARPDSRNVSLRDAGFRGYADHMEGDEFRAALEELVEDAAWRSTAVMCSESSWWRCHRRLLADALTLGPGLDVRHLLHDGRLEDHGVTEGARAGEEVPVVYDLGSTPHLPGVS